jgi:hypothetical protein
MNLKFKPNPNFFNINSSYSLYILLEYVGGFDELNRAKRLKFLNIGYQIFKNKEYSKYEFVRFHKKKKRIFNFISKILISIITSCVIFCSIIGFKYKHDPYILTFFLDSLYLILGLAFLHKLLFKGRVLANTNDTSELLSEMDNLETLVSIPVNDDLGFEDYGRIKFDCGSKIFNEILIESSTLVGLEDKKNIIESLSINQDSKTLIEKESIILISNNNNLEDTQLRNKNYNDLLFTIPIFSIKPKYAGKFFNAIKLYFAPNDQISLEKLILENIEPKRPLLFRAKANQFADAFFQIHENNLVITNSKKNMINWIIKNFQYMGQNDTPTRFDFENLENLIYNQSSKCSYKLFTIEKNNEEVRFISE